MQDQFTFMQSWLATHYKECPSDPAAPGHPAQPNYPGFARDRWAEIQKRLPKPSLTIAPGRAITGKTAYLEIRDTGPQSFAAGNPLGGAPVSIEARPTYTVDWGDGSSTKTSSNGGPWPSGDVTHVYEATGRNHVRVTANWSASWRGDGQGGGLPGLATVGALDLPVTQVQAIRDR